MALTWSSDVKKVSFKPALEQVTRDTISAACAFFDALPAGGELPRFNGGRHVNAINQLARDLEAACKRDVPEFDALIGIDYATTLATAVHCAELYFSAGAGEKGSEAVTKAFAGPRTQFAMPVTIPSK